MCDISIIIELSTKFRVAIEQLIEPTQVKELGFFKYFSNFPRCCCGDTSELLSKYLSENNIVTKYVSGMCGRQSHAWLEYGDYIIDITADQFNDVKEKVVVTSDKSWHSRFIVQEKRHIDFENREGFLQYEYRRLYQKIVSQIALGNIHNESCGNYG